MPRNLKLNPDASRPHRDAKTASLQGERKRMFLEMAALAYVQMEHNDYVFPEGAHHGRKQPDGSYEVNKSEVLRRAGYSPQTRPDRWYLLDDNDEFWSLVELHRIRYTDPMFRQENEKHLLEIIGGEAMRGIYEDLLYHPHTVTLEQKLKVAKFVLEAGVEMVKLEGKKNNRLEQALSLLDHEGRKKVVQSRLNNIEREKGELERAMRAVEGKNVSEVPVSSPGMGSSPEGEQ